MRKNPDELMDLIEDGIDRILMEEVVEPIETAFDTAANWFCGSMLLISLLLVAPDLYEATAIRAMNKIQEYSILIAKRWEIPETYVASSSEPDYTHFNRIRVH